MILSMNKLRISIVTAALLISGAADAQILKNEPGDGALPRGKRVLVDDGSCPAGQIKEVIGGSKIDHVARSSRCIPHGSKNNHFRSGEASGARKYRAGSCWREPLA
jgi:hypothetical protein